LAANVYRRTGQPQDDVEQIALLGILQAAYRRRLVAARPSWCSRDALRS
jgi:hypothetical protein